MKLFNSEKEFLSILDKYDQIVRDCLVGKITFTQFIESYDSFYMAFALDGHESDAEEKDILKLYEHRIAPHFEIWDSILSAGLCADEDATKDEYKKAGRFGSDEAINRLQIISNKYSIN